MTLPAEEYARRLKAAEGEIHAAGIWPSNAMPPLFRLMRKLGMQVRPPHYLPFVRAAITSGAFFGVVWGAIMYVTVWRAQGAPASVYIPSSLIAAGLFGVMMAACYQYGRKKHGFSNWDDL